MMPKRSSPWRAIGGFAALLVLALMAWPVPGGVGVTTAVADESELIKIAPGSYAATGTSPIGKSYDGMVAIEPLGKILAVLWRLGTGDAYKGIGLETGAVFGVAYSTDQPVGLVVYRVDGGHLDGRWSLAMGECNELSREFLDGPSWLN